MCKKCNSECQRNSAVLVLLSYLTNKIDVYGKRRQSEKLKKILSFKFLSYFHLGDEKFTYIVIVLIQ